MSRKSRIIILIVGIVLIFLLLLGLTYGYYVTRVKGNENPNSISLETANLVLEYGDGNKTITAYNILPGETITSKYFTVTNKGNETIEDYVVVLEDVINNFYLREDLTYKLTCSSVDKDTLVKTGTCKGSSGAFPRDEEVIVINDIDAGIMHKYYLTVTFNETYLDQSIDMNKTLKARVNIYDRREKNPYLTDSTEMKTYLNNINELENYAAAYLGSSATSKGDEDYFIDKTKWLVFSTISKISYNDEKWTEVAGPEDKAFLSSFEGIFDINVLAGKYLASDNGEYSGITHFAAAISALNYNTPALVNAFGYTEGEFNDLAGWAGDLQTLINNNLLSKITNQNDYNEVYTKMSDLIGKSGTTFSSDDLYADLDAKNIYSLLKSGTPIKNSMESYYSTGYKTRFATFIKLLTSDNTYETLNSKVHKYTKYDSYWKLLKTSYSTTVGQACADAFSDYLWYMANLKKLNIFSHNIEFIKGNEYEFIAEYINTSDAKDETLVNSDYTWTVTKVDGSSSSSTISNGVLTIPSTETASELLITITLNKSNKVTASRIIKVN